MKPKFQHVWPAMTAMAVSLIICAACTTIVRPDYPGDWPKLSSPADAGDFAGAYDNRSDGHTMTATAQADDRPLLTRMLGVKFELGDAEVVTVRAVSGELALTFRDAAGRRLDSFQVGPSSGWRWDQGRFVNRESSAAKGVEAERYDLERRLYQAEDGSLIVELHVVSTIGTIARQTRDETQWARFPRRDDSDRRRPPPPRNRGRITMR